MKLKNVLTTLLIAGILMPQVSMGMDDDASGSAASASAPIAGIHIDEVETFLPIVDLHQLNGNRLLNLAKVKGGKYDRWVLENQHCALNQSVVDLAGANVGVGLYDSKSGQPLVEVAGFPERVYLMTSDKRTKKEIEKDEPQGPTGRVLFDKEKEKKAEIGMAILSDRLKLVSEMVQPNPQPSYWRGERAISPANTTEQVFVFTQGKGGILPAVKGLNLLGQLQNATRIDFAITDDQSFVTIKYMGKMRPHALTPITINVPLFPFGKELDAAVSEVQMEAQIIPEALPEYKKTELDAILGEEIVHNTASID